MNEFTDQLFLQMVQDTLRVVMVFDAIYVIWIVGVAMKWLLNLIWKWVTKGSKAVARLLGKVFNRPEVEVVAEQNMEV